MRKRTAAVSETIGSSLRPFTSAERALPIAVASIVAVAALLAFLPTTPQGAVSGIQGSTAAPRLAVGGSERDTHPETAAIDGGPAPAGLVGPATSFTPVSLPGAVTNDPAVEPSGGVDTSQLPAYAVTPAATTEPESAVQDDGTLLTGYAPETAVEDGADLIRTYKVQKGDTLGAVAKKFDVSMMTLWWANKLKSKDLKTGKVLRIPPVSGLVYTVKDTDTLATVAKSFKVDPSKIVELNGLEDPTLVVGQVLVLPGAKGAPMPTPKPAVRSGVGTAGAGGGAVLGGGPATYPGGKFHWPVIGGNNYVSQYFHYGHWAIDIAADYGSRVVAAAPGKVIFAGWKNNGGGYQVWIAHGSGIYTTYNHMSAITVSNGASVGRGQQVGRIGASGNATGPHLHFEVWNGPVWNGGTRVNPLNYF
ncbi:MAG TPA: M23 family metallopeptidase [Candidatus Limnocylindrales bacterium]|nr:M23 family metallopeptidase [Candidatus Limnocylindrales bacterium]